MYTPSSFPIPLVFFIPPPLFFHTNCTAVMPASIEALLDNRIQILSSLPSGRKSEIEVGSEFSPFSYEVLGGSLPRT